MAGELRLIVEAHERRQLGGSGAPEEQLLRAGDAQVRQVRVRRHADLGAKCAAKVEFVEAGVTGQVVEGDGIAEACAQVLERAADGTRVVGWWTSDHDERIHCFGGGDLEGEAVGSRTDGIEEAVKRRGTLVTPCELRDHCRFALALDPSDVSSWQRDGSERSRPAVGQMANDVAGLFDEDAAWYRAPDLAATPPFRLAVLDAPDAVVVLHAGVQRRRRSPHCAERRERDGQLDEGLHHLDIARRACGRSRTDYAKNPQVLAGAGQ